MKTSPSLISVVDDDESVREALPDLLRVFGFETEAFASAEEFLDSGSPERSEFLILDISMPGMSGPELHRELVRRGQDVPTIFITANQDQKRAPLLEQGAVECLFKPFSDTELRDALNLMICND